MVGQVIQTENNEKNHNTDLRKKDNSKDHQQSQQYNLDSDFDKENFQIKLKMADLIWSDPTSS